MAPAGEVDTARGEFWVGDPFNYPAHLNLSAYERNAVLLNLGGLRFLEVGYLSGADSDGDARGVLVADCDGDLAPDLIVRQLGGGALRVYANRFPAARRLVVSLEGGASNRLGIGARLVAQVSGRTITRDLFPANNFRAQQGSFVEFGLGDAERVDRLQIRWPSGLVQELASVEGNRHIRIKEGVEAYEVLRVGRGG